MGGYAEAGHGEGTAYGNTQMGGKGRRQVAFSVNPVDQVAPPNPALHPNLAAFYLADPVEPLHIDEDSVIAQRLAVLRMACALKRYRDAFPI